MQTLSYAHRVSVRLILIDPSNDSGELTRFLSTNRFPFHVAEAPSEADARSRVAEGTFGGPDNLAYWIEHEGARVGLLNFQELADGTPMIDMRLAEGHRGKGIGTAALGLGTSEVFVRHPTINRIEGNTRADNVAMRVVFERNRYVKEAHYREGWTVVGSEPMDSVAYAIIRRDWERGSITPIDWDEPLLSFRLPVKTSELNVPGATIRGLPWPSDVLREPATQPCESQARRENDGERISLDDLRGSR